MTQTLDRLEALVKHIAKVIPPAPDRLKGKPYSKRKWRNAYMRDLMRKKRAQAQGSR
ncbi:MAG: hypothetical protein J2P55_11050 [Rhizobiales bacterium]|nr:hypothetical protein [Hyphomicrobiales bacterium]